MEYPKTNVQEAVASSLRDLIASLGDAIDRVESIEDSIYAAMNGPRPPTAAGVGAPAAIFLSPLDRLDCLIKRVHAVADSLQDHRSLL